MLLSYNKLVGLVDQGVIDAAPENINGASIDITLSNQIMVEDNKHQHIIDLGNKQAPCMWPVSIDEPFMLFPGQFILASTNETFNLPNTIAAEYKLKSSLARSGLQHMLAGWCDPGWSGSRLTLELKNVTQSHILVLRAGMKIGQMLFFECEPVTQDQSYAVKGQYNNQTTVTASKGVR